MPTVSYFHYFIYWLPMPSMTIIEPIFLQPAVSILLVLVHVVSPHINSQWKGTTLHFFFLVLDAITLKQLLQTVINTSGLLTIEETNGKWAVSWRDSTIQKKTCKQSKELYFTHIVIHALDSHHHWSCQLRLKQASFFLTPPSAARKKVREEERPHRNSWRAGGGGHIALSCPALNLPSLSNGF